MELQAIVPKLTRFSRSDVSIVYEDGGGSSDSSSWYRFVVEMAGRRYALSGLEWDVKNSAGEFRPSEATGLYPLEFDSIRILNRIQDRRSQGFIEADLPRTPEEYEEVGKVAIAIFAQVVPPQGHAIIRVSFSPRENFPKRTFEVSADGGLPGDRPA